MNLIKLGFFSGIIAPSKSRKHIPTPIWIQKKGKRLIKIEETHQEEEEAPQTPMSTSTEDPMSHQILKALNEHREALKKIMGRLTKLEEAKLKKPSHIEINNEEYDMEEWKKRIRLNMKETNNLRSSPKKP